MLRHQGLNKQGLRLNANRHQVKEQFPGIFPEFFRIVGHRHGMVIHHPVDAIVLFLQGDPVLHCPEVVAKVHLPGGLNSRKDLFALLHGHFFGQREYTCSIGFGAIKTGNSHQKPGFGQPGSHSTGKSKLGRPAAVRTFAADSNNTELRMRILIVVFALLTILPACQSGYQPADLQGNWQAVAITEEGTPLAVDPSQIELQFTPADRYTYRSTLNYREAGSFYVDGTYLFTRDTLNQASTEKAVEILKLANDTLQLKMMDGDKERLLTMVKR